jgi:hypothetical protein
MYGGMGRKDGENSLFSKTFLSPSLASRVPSDVFVQHPNVVARSKQYCAEECTAI